jgi:hypothetical protein
MGLTNTQVRTGVTAPNTYKVGYPESLVAQSIGNNVNINRTMQNIA